MTQVNATNWNRHRNGAKPKRQTLERLNDAINARQPVGYIHPTKGFRSISSKRAVAMRIAAEMKRGFPYTMEMVKRDIRHAGVGDMVHHGQPEREHAHRPR